MPSDEEVALLRYAVRSYTNGTNTIITEAAVWNSWISYYDALVMNGMTSTTIGTISATITNVWTDWNQRQWLAGSSKLNEWAPARGALCEENFRQQLRQQQKAALRVRATKRLAKIKAEHLLISALAEEQRMDLKRYGYFKLYVQRGEATRVYRIRRGQVQNIELMEELPNGDLKPVRTLCAHPSILVPDADAMLAQKLMLETNEAEFLRIANHFAAPRDPSIIRRSPMLPSFPSVPQLIGSQRRAA
jgi:hypothetical protein